MGVEHYKDWYWTIIKGDACKGWIKAIFYLDPTDVKIYIYTILGTSWKESSFVGADNETEDSLFPADSQGWGSSNVLTNGGYTANLLQNAELNIFADIIFKDIVTIKLMAINIPITASVTPIYGASIDVDLGKIGMGAAWRYDSASSINQSVWAAHFVLNELLSINIPGGFPFEALNNIGFGFFAAGNLANPTNPASMAFNVTHMQLILELGADVTCCFPSIHIGMHLAKSSSLYDQGNGMLSGIGLSEIWGKYTHELGVYGPVTLTGRLGVIYAFSGGFVDNPVVCEDADGFEWGGWGEQIFSGPAIGVSYEVEGSMKW